MNFNNSNDSLSSEPNFSLDTLERKNMVINLLKKTKEHLKIQLMNATRTIREKESIIKQLECDLNEAKQKLAEKNNAALK